MAITRTKKTTEKEAPKKKPTGIKYEVLQEAGTISIDNNWELKLRFVKWGENEPKWDLRKWKDTEDGEKSGKGITLTEDELFDLKDFLVENLKEEEPEDATTD